MIANQRSLIEGLAQSHQNYVRRFEEMKLSIDIKSSPPDKEHACFPSSDLSPFQSGLKHNDVLLKAHYNPFPGPAASLAPNVEHDQQSHDFLQMALGHFSTLTDSLLREVRAPTYKIPNRSRSRIEENVFEIHNREMSEAKAILACMRQHGRQQLPLQPEGQAPQNMNDYVDPAFIQPLIRSPLQRTANIHDVGSESTKSETSSEEPLRPHQPSPRSVTIPPDLHLNAVESPTSESPHSFAGPYSRFPCHNTSMPSNYPSR